LSHGSSRPEDVDPQWHPVAREVDLAGALQRGLDAGRIDEPLARLAPQAPQYQALQRAVQHYRSMPATTDGGAAAADRVRQLEINMDRWRWLPDDLGSRYVLVNIPAFRLDVIEGGKSVLAMNVVAGKKDSPTPVLSDRMKYVVFSPYWNIPAEIAQKEIAPKVDSDPG